MAKNEITKKLENILKTTRVYKHEMEVVYIFVGIRKLLEHSDKETQTRFELLRFYCDWVLHIEKSRSFRVDANRVLEDLYLSCERSIMYRGRIAQNASDFIYLKPLYATLIEFFREYYLDTFLLSDKACWLSFIKTFNCVVNDQPIYKTSGSKIEGLQIYGASERSVSIRIFFKEPIQDPDGHDRHWYDLSNGY